MLKASFTFFALAFVLIYGSPADNDGSWRVVGGSEAKKGAAPYQIILWFRSSFKCSGSIISKKTILTAAHCVKLAEPSNLSVIAGTNLLNSGGIHYKVDRYLRHEGYDWSNTNDLALIILKDEIIYSNLISPIAIEKKVILGGASANLTGWGMTSVPGDVSENLQTITLKVISHDNCKKTWGNNVIPSQICTLTHKGEGACHGDSGGPLVVNNKLIGVVSWGNPCANGYPDVYSRISSFADWIENNTVY